MAIVNFHLSHACNISATSEKQLSTINLSQVCIYTNAAFLAAADSKKFVFFDVKTGRQVGELRIPTHLDRTKAKVSLVQAHVD